MEKWRVTGKVVYVGTEEVTQYDEVVTAENEDEALGHIYRQEGGGWIVEHENAKLVEGGNGA